MTPNEPGARKMVGERVVEKCKVKVLLICTYACVLYAQYLRSRSYIALMNLA